MLQKILPIKELKKRCLQLSEIDERLSNDEIFVKFLIEQSKILTGNEIMPFARLKFPLNKFEDICFYRITSFKNFDRNNVSQYSYPPFHMTPRGRCNLPKFPVFYCCDRGLLSLIEFIKTHPSQTTEELFLSEWTITQKYEWKMLSVIFSGLPLENYYKELGNKHYPRIYENFKEFMDESEIEKYINFYHHEFTRRTHYFSSIISHMFLYLDEQDMVIYPSIAFKKLDCNYAFNIKVLDKGILKLRRVYSLKINVSDRITDYYHNPPLTLTGIGDIVSNNSLEWRKVTNEGKAEFAQSMLNDESWKQKGARAKREQGKP